MKILVRVPNWVGDAVMCIPALEALRKSRAGDKVTILARPAVADVLSGQPFADRIIEYDYRGRHQGWLGREALIRELRLEKFDAAVLFQNAFEAAWLAWRARIPVRIGYARDARGALLTNAVPLPKENEIPRHESHYYREMLRRAGWIESREEIGRVRLLIPAGAREFAEAALREAGARAGAWRCAIAPGASYGAAKCWPPEKFAALADRLISECGADVIFFGTSAEKEIIARIFSVMKCRAISLAGETSMRNLAALFSGCSVFVGNDSGAMHVAAAAGLPVIGIFGSTDPEGTSPLTTQFTLIREAASCSPCFLRRCPVDHRCMTRIAAETVFLAARRAGGAPGDIPAQGAPSA
jgi:heptosyltransferase II